MRKGASFRDLDWFLLAVALALAAVGVVEIYSTTAHSALAGEYKRQIYWILAGSALALAISRLDYHFFLERTPALYAVSIFGLGAVLFAGHAVARTHRWLSLGGQTFQVSEMVKLVIIISVAAYLAGSKGKPVTWKGLAVLGLLAGVPTALVALEPDLGTALTYLPIVAAGVFLAGIRARQVLVLLLLGAVMLPVGWRLMRPYQRERLMSFAHPSDNAQGSGYQVAQSKIAIGSGGFRGKGIGNGTQSRLGFIPVSHADFILSAFGEEQGFVGIFCVLLLYFLLLVRLLDGAHLASDPAGAFLIVGLTSVLFFQVAVNAGMMIGLVPITGIPLPLMSQGGSSVLFTFAGLGLAMSVKMRRFVN
ncbi:MAG TPA: rod shape-determining protein RodA [Terriglobia bacterium]|nr:rod shape-determining protein RodA [Terriglobia bacterium]